MWRRESAEDWSVRQSPYYIYSHQSTYPWRPVLHMLHPLYLHWVFSGSICHLESLPPLPISNTKRIWKGASLSLVTLCREQLDWYMMHVYQISRASLGSSAMDHATVVMCQEMPIWTNWGSSRKKEKRTTNWDIWTPAVLPQHDLGPLSAESRLDLWFFFIKDHFF